MLQGSCSMELELELELELEPELELELELELDQSLRKNLEDTSSVRRRRKVLARFSSWWRWRPGAGQMKTTFSQVK